MNKLRLLILSVLIATGAQATLKTSAQDGLLGSGSTWVGGVVPTPGVDQISLYHTVYATFTVTIGSGPAVGGAWQLHLNSTGTFVALSGSSVTINGPIRYTAGTSNTTDAVRVTAGATVNMVQYDFTPDNNFGWRKFTAIGTSTAPAVVIGNGGSSAGLKTGGFAYVGGYTFDYAVLRNLTFTMYYRDDNGTADPTQWIVTNSTFSGCGQITNSGGLHPDAVFRHEHNTHINTTSSNVFDFRIGYAKSAAGRRIISSSTFDASLGSNLGLKDFYVAGNYFNERFQALYSSGTFRANFHRLTTDNMSIGVVSTSYFLLEADLANPHLINTVTLNDSYDGNVFAQGGRNPGDSGECFIGGGGPIVSTYTITRSIFPPNSEGYSPWQITSMIASGGDPNSYLNYYYNFTHNTWFGGNTITFPFPAAQYSETANIGPGRLTFKSNLAFNPQLTGKRASFSKALDVGNIDSDNSAGYGTGPTSNVCTAASCNYNASFGMSHSSYTSANSSKYLNQGRGYIGNFTSTPGANDVDGTDPNFVDYKRNAEKFDGDYYRPYMALPTATLWFSTNTYTVGTVVRHSSSTYYWGDSINFRYVNKSGCSGANPEPGIPGLSSWTNCWEFASYQTIKDAIANGLTFTDSTIGASNSDVVETLVRWVQYGYRPQATGLSTAAHDGGTIGAMPALLSGGGAPVVTPSVPAVLVSSSIVLTSDQSVTFSLAAGSTGTLSGATSTSVTYNAPGPIRAKQSLYGCPLLPQDHVFNTKVSNLPVDTSSTTYLHTQLSGGAQIVVEVDMPDNLYSNSTSSTNMVFNYTPAANGPFKMASFPDLRVENGIFTDKDQVDQHIFAMDKDSCLATELYKLYPIGTQTDCLTCNSQSGVRYGNSYNFTLGVDAAGLPILPLTVGYRELRDCVDFGIPISHAVRMTFSVGILSNTHIWPAIAHATDGGELPFGARLRLKSTFTNTGSAAAQCVQQMLKDYGAFANDGGINGHIQFRQDSAGDYELFQALTTELSGLSGFTTDNLEVVDQSSFRDSDPLSATYNSGRVKETNPYETPTQYAIVIASNTTTHQVTQMPIIVQPVTIGVEKPLGYSFLAGTPQTQLNVWVRGAVDQTFSCSMSPAYGSLTSGGLYTPPSSSVARSSGVVTCSATADPNTKVRFPIYIYPSNGIRVRLAQASDTDYGPDANSKTWFVERGSLWRLQGKANCDWSAESWSGVTDSGLYKQCQYVSSGSGDLLFKANVPNGDYTIKLYFAVGGGSSPFSRGSWVQGIDSQGSIYSGNSATTMTGNGPWTQLGLTGKQVDVCDITGSCASRVPGVVTLTKTVSDGTIYFAIRHLAPYSVSQPASLLNAFSIEPGVAGSMKTISGNYRISGAGIIQW